VATERRLATIPWKSRGSDVWQVSGGCADVVPSATAPGPLRVGGATCEWDRIIRSRNHIDGQMGPLPDQPSHSPGWLGLATQPYYQSDCGQPAFSGEQ
jgi:hypothetical protein